MVACGILVLFTVGSLGILFSEDGTPGRLQRIGVGKNTATAAAPKETKRDGLWEGPVLYHHPPDKPIHLILVDKSTQKLFLYRYSGGYRLVKEYFCATGEKRGKKQKEKDEKTPEGIFFNNRTYRDRKITVFGDRAFGLNYPDVFDRLSGNRGGGIFIHGSNRPVSPFSTNGCLVMNNRDLADLDQRVDMQHTPVIIGARLPYRFSAAKGGLSEVIPFFKKALLPEKHAGKRADYESVTVLSFMDRMVVSARLRIQAEAQIQGASRLYLADAGNSLLVLLRREWTEEKRSAVVAKAPVGEKKALKTATGETAAAKNRLRAIIESWRKAWQGKRINDYIGHYHPAFSNKGRSLSQWKAYKDRLNKRYRKISVTVSGIRVILNGGGAHAYFRQAYRSDAFRSDCYKILEFRRNAGEWKIYREKSFPKKPARWPA